MRKETLEVQKSLYNEVLTAYRENPDDPDAIIWLGRITACIGQYMDAAAIFTSVIEKHPDNPKLYRHRSHRFITLRRFGLAVRDFEKVRNLGYRVANWFLYNGDEKRAVSALHKIVATDGWTTFGYIAA